MTQHLDDFIEALAAQDVAADAANIYAHGSDFNAVRRENLRLYLAQMLERRPKVLLVGEAPGYLGCRRTGLPFCSEYTLINPPEGVPLLGESRGYRLSGEFDKIRKEPSGTIVWQTLADTGFFPAIWASFPYHPHQKGKPMSNRAPRAPELAIGRGFLTTILDLFQPAEIVAVGNNADKTLAVLDIPHVKVRHPSHGGKADFVAGFRAVVEKYTKSR